MTAIDLTARALADQLRRDAEASGYYLNPDEEFVLLLCEGLLTNRQRYGYLACPCRLAAGIRDRDRDIICPCDYRDADVEEFGTCYCALYVSAAIARGEDTPRPIPERRPYDGPAESATTPAASPAPALAYPVWRCNVCGYLCARNHPPGVCPICKADKDRFSRFM